METTGNYIERFYSKEFGSWVALLKNSEGDQVADALYEYSKREIKKIKISDFKLYDWVNNEQ